MEVALTMFWQVKSATDFPAVRETLKKSQPVGGDYRKGPRHGQSRIWPKNLGLSPALKK
jgi:hypothetical protein